MNKLSMRPIVLTALILSSLAQICYADETVTEKVAATSNDAKRGMKKGAHRVQEALCMDGDVECAAGKVKNRIIEAGDATSDAAVKVKNKID
jgi:uncharacterized protein YjbJ (UPF0337 family)